MVGKITRATYIGGIPVAKDKIVDVDETTFAILSRCGKIEAHKPGRKDKTEETAKPKFTEVDGDPAD